MRNILTVSKLLPVLTLSVLASCGTDSNDTPDNPADENGFRKPTSSSSAFANKVYDYTPAPGQFINDTRTGGFTGKETTPELATAWAEKRLDEGKFVSLGAFGGYIVVGFDHSIAPGNKDYDFAIKGNATATSNEPGIVWVMRDENRNGLPDDTWYQLRGSETGKPETIENFTVTYYKPEHAGMPVKWSASDGTSGEVDYIKSQHKQDYYYPNWITAESYTLSGTKLQARNVQDNQTGNWDNKPYDYGYADNRGSDSFGDAGEWVGFKISNAIDNSGNSVNLPFIDFIKVQQGVMSQSGWLGENSCEILSIKDL